MAINLTNILLYAIITLLFAILCVMLVNIMSEVSKQEIDSAREEIDQLLFDDPEMALDKIFELNDKCQYAADYYLGIAYSLGLGVEENQERALHFFRNAVLLHDDLEGDALYFIGLYYQNCGDYQEALQYYNMAVDKDCDDAFEKAAVCLYSLSNECRTVAAKTLKMDEFTLYNSYAIEYALQSISLFSSIVADVDEDMEIVSWCCFGRATQFLYNVACRGEFTTEIKQDNNFLSYLSGGFDTFSQRNDLEFHEHYWQYLVAACYAMDNHGHEIIGEYFRALGGLLDAELHHSAEAFYRVRWHMKRIGELRKNISAEEAAEIHEILSDVDDSYKKMSKKYGALTDSMISRGEYPNLEPSYFENSVPTVESCQNFMDMFNAYRSGSVSAQQPSEPNRRSGLFSLFKR